MKKRALLGTTSLQSPDLQSLTAENLNPLPEEIAGNVNQSEHSLSVDDGAHLDGVEAVEGEGMASMPEPSDVARGDVVVPMPQWVEGFLGGFNLAGNFVKALKIMPEEEGKARAAAEAIYNTALEVDSLRFLIAPQGKWIGRGAAVFMFAGPKIVAARDEIRSRRAGAGPLPAAGGDSKHMAPVAGERDQERAQF